MERNRDSRITSSTVTGSTAAARPAGLLVENGFGNDLPRFCFEPDVAEAKRTLAWVNSICLVYLVMGLMGLKPLAPAINRRPTGAEEAVPTVVEPLITAAQTVSPDSSSEETPSERNTEDTLGGVAVTVDSSAVAFSVPTVGNLLVPLNKAQPPPAHPMQAVVSLSTAHIEQIGVTGMSGSRPAPPYPRESLMSREEGTVLLLIEVDETGKITAVTVKESSGYPRLDRATADYVRHHWLFSAAKETRLYESPIVFQLK